jgi:hypothetical protein
MRPLNQIARDINKNWTNVYFGARPYLNAMYSLNGIDDVYGMDSARSIVRYFLANASSFKGDKARELKNELKGLLK